MLKSISEYISKVIGGDKVQINGQSAQWKKVDQLRPGMKIAVVNNNQFSSTNLQSSSNDQILNENSAEDVVFEEVVSIEHVGRERVWDIEVEGTHNFVGNGILAHNTYISGNVGIGTTSPSQALDIGAGGFTVTTAGNVVGGTYNSATLNNTTLAGTSSFTVTGGTGASNTLTLVSTTHGTKGNIQFFDSTSYIGPTGNLVLNGSVTQNGAGDNYFAGNVGIGTTAPEHPLEMASGAHVTTGGVWTDNSSREVKENFINLDLSEILGKIGQLSIQSWNYKAEDPSIRHLGPMAEDFYEIFNIGNDNRHLAALDTSGIALAGVKGLLLQLDESNNRENYHIFNLTVTGELEIQGTASFKDQVEFGQKTIFQALAEFFNEVIFRGTVNFFGKVKHLADVTFLGRATFNQDTGGFAIIKKGQKEVEIVFAREYEKLPVVTTTINLAPETVLNETPSYGIALPTTKGFKIKLGREIGEDLRFAWTAIAVENAKTFSSPETDVSAPPVDAPAEPTITPTLAPTTAPVAAPTAAPAVEPTAAPAVETPTPEPTAGPTAGPTTAAEPTQTPSPTPTPEEVE